jgi:hypothetical protein
LPNRIERWAQALALYCALAPAAQPARAAVPTTADVNAAARAAGNRPAEARTLGQALLASTWPAQILKIRVDGIAGHEVAGLVLSGVKFHGRLDRAGFEREVGELVRRGFAAVPVEEIDVWATVPIPYDKREPVTGDYAQPVSRVVFAATCGRAEIAEFGSRLRAGEGVYWAADFLRRL